MNTAVIGYISLAVTVVIFVLTLINNGNNRSIKDNVGGLKAEMSAKITGLDQNITLLRSETTKQNEANTAAHKEFWQEINATKLKVKGVSMIQRLCKTCTDHISPDLDEDNPVHGG